MISKCICQKCGEAIEFEADDMERSGETAHRILGQVIDCPHCGVATQLYLNKANFRHMPNTSSRKSFNWGLTGLILLGAGLLVAVMYYFGTSLGEAMGQIIPALGGAIAGMVMIFIFAVIIILVLFWIIFPWMVYSKTNQVIELLEKIERNTRKEK